ncbi:MAG TPA: ABC transporter substrate-binding protein [Gammaproteobacteria bacterium]
MSARQGRFVAIIVAALLALAGCDGAATASRHASAAARGEATVLLMSGLSGDWPTGLDPAASTTSLVNSSIMNAIYGGLFQLAADDDGHNARLVGVLAESYDVRDDGRTIVIRLRRHVRFSDGTPLDAAALRFNIERNLAAPCVCAPTAWPWADEPVTTLDERTIALHFDRPYPAAVTTFPTSTINWPVSPAALRRLGEAQFKVTPVGAGPFRVVSNQASTRLVLERNPHYWQAGRPHLARLVFQSIGSEQAAYQALIAGDAHVFEGLTSVPLIRRAEADERITVTRQPATSPYMIQLNTLAPPFDDQRAREAIYHATDVEAIRRGLFHGWYPASQSFTAPGGLFHHAAIPGYRTYDLEKARAIVAGLGGLSITLGTTRAGMAEQIATALQAQWRKAGIDVAVASYDVAALLPKYRSGRWHAMLQTVGAYDPESLLGVISRFRSDRPFTGVKDAHLDRLLVAAAGTFDMQQRDALYFQAGRYISDKAYAPFLFAAAPVQATAGGIRGPGLTTRIPPLALVPGTFWQDVRFDAE